MELDDQIDMNRLFRTRYENECVSVNRFMTWLMVGQWLLGVFFAAFWSPFTWIGQQYELHVHVWAAVLIGGALSGCAILWMRLFPRATHTRHIVAIAQVLWSALLIHLSGGRIETHFHVFASLAILSLYRDWKILISATIVVALDHSIRGVFYPVSVFGVLTESPFRWIEHAAWVLFEVSFLVPGCRRLRNEFHELCARQTDIEEAKRTVSDQVEQRTSELRRANRLLAEKSTELEMLAMVAKYTDNAVVITSPTTEIQWVNDGYSRVTGYTPEEAIGQRPAEFLHGPETDPKTIAKMKQAISNRHGCNAEVVYYRKSGEPFWMALEIRPIKNKSGEVERFMSIQSDITQRKQMELSLADTEARLRSIINNVPGVFYRRRIGGNNQTIFVSDWIQNLTGHEPAEFVRSNSISHLDLVHPEDFEEVQATILAAVQDCSEFECEYRIIDREGNTKWIWEKGQCKQSEDCDASMYLDGMLFDVTEKVQAEIENQTLHRELIDVSRRVGMAEIATGVLHNVGNILNSVNISASMIRKRFDKSALSNLQRVSHLIAENEATFDSFVRDDDRGRHIPAYIRKVTETLSDESSSIRDEFDDLIKNVEHIKQIVSVQQSLAKCSGLQTEVYAEDLINDALATYEDSLQKHRIEVDRSVAPSLPQFVSDKHRILQILVNLVKNAKDALVERATKNAKIRIEAMNENDFVLFRVTDNGMGIPTAKLETIFQHGFTTKKTGHGFGLHSSANAATEIGGSLSAKSEGEGQGATFELRVPYTAVSNHKAAEVAV